MENPICNKRLMVLPYKHSQLVQKQNEWSD